MSDLLGYKCPNCGGNIIFKPDTQQFQCESCDSVFTKQQLDEHKKKLEALMKENGDNASGQYAAPGGESYSWENAGSGGVMPEEQLYSCKSCGAQIIGDGTTAASECPYCGSPVIMQGMVSGLNKPDCVIPFKLTEKDAAEALTTLYKGKYFIPKQFRFKNKVSEIKAVYVPFWLFDSNVSASCVYEGTRSRHWSDSNYNYTETDHFRIERNGNLSFSRVPVDGSSKMDDSYMDSIEPFDYSGMVDFDTAYLSGFLADKFDVSAEDSFPRAQTRIKNSTENAFRSTIKGFETVTNRGSSIDARDGSYKYALLPVYILNTKYQGKDYRFAVNGQTGKVTGFIPTDKGKYWGTLIGIAAALFALGQIIILR